MKTTDLRHQGFNQLKGKGQISTVHAIKELDGFKRSASVCGRFAPGEISPASQRREAEKDENPELMMLKKKKKKSISPGIEPGFLRFPGCSVVTIPTEL